jgi:hypothetical protein
MDVTLEPAEIAEWEAEDLIAGHLSAELEIADRAAARAMLDGVRLALPGSIDHRELVDYSARRGTPLDESLVPDLTRFDFHLVELPLGILVPESRRLVRLRLGVRITTGVAYDLFPRDEWADVEHEVGQVSLDVAKALTFVSPPLGEALGLTLAHPLRWKSRTVRVRTTDRLSNPVEWYVTDRSVNEGFTAHLIVRSAKGDLPTLHTTVACELRKSGPLGRVMKATYLSGDHSYQL